MNVPNALSLFRIILAPLFAWVYFSGENGAHMWAALVYTAAFLTDMLDGWIARHFDLITRLGRILDPLADKLMTLTVLLCICMDRVIPVWTVALFFLKETVMGLGGVVLFQHTRDVISANWLGKCSTGVFFAVLGALLLFPEIPPNIATTLISLALLLAFAALLRYIWLYRKIITHLPEEK